MHARFSIGEQRRPAPLLGSTSRSKLALVGLNRTSILLVLESKIWSTGCRLTPSTTCHVCDLCSAILHGVDGTLLAPVYCTRTGIYSYKLFYYFFCESQSSGIFNVMIYQKMVGDRLKSHPSKTLNVPCERWLCLLSDSILVEFCLSWQCI